MTAPPHQAEYTQEVRFAVVMYGGVSLAIYINGIAQELLRLVRSTAKQQNGFNGTERIYRKVSHLLADESLSMADLNKLSADNANLPPTRFLVDILSGTSAGGINGIFLAKALANGQDMEQLKDLWVTEGDIETLINDRRSVEKPLSLQDPPTSLLNSERMYFKLLDAFDGMDKNDPSRKEDAPSPFVDELDLFVTSTDLQGVVLPIRLSDDLVYERRHRNVMHFLYSEPSVSGEDTRNDFHGSYNPFLAFAARCTSSFPFAFEPMCLTDTDAILRRIPRYKNVPCSSDSKAWQRFYRDYLDPRGVSTVKFANRSFGDGGYLDNKPFSYATEALMNRNADVPVDRKLIYIEPSPEHPEDDVERDDKPDAIENVMSALLTLPRYETIREDLERVKERNRLIDRVNSITSGVDRDEDAVRIQSEGKAPATEYDSWKELGALAAPSTPELWSREHLREEEVGQLDLADMIKRKGRAYAGYHRLRISAVTDQIAKLIARVAGFDENSDYFVIVRAMVRAWRVKTYVEHRLTPEQEKLPTANQFLYEFDLSYPLRRINYLRNKADALHRLDPNALTIVKIIAKDFNLDLDQQPLTEPQVEAFQDEVLRFKRTLNELFVDLRRAGRSLRSRHTGQKTEGQQAPSTVSPVKTLVRTLMEQIEASVRKLATKPDSPSVVLDYFLGKSNGTARSYRADSPEEDCNLRTEEFLSRPENAHIVEQFLRTAEALKDNVLDAKNDAEEKSIALFSAKDTNPISGNLAIDTVIWIARRTLAHYYENYEDYDLLTYPILFETGVGEADSIDIIRISPEDAKQLIDERETGCHKLAGSALGHFGAFLARQWRQNDILWGRLDGAERIVAALLPNHPLRKQLIGEAQAQIIVETIEVMGEQERSALLAESWMRTRTRKSESNQLDGFIRRLIDNSASDPQLQQRLQELINPNELRQYYEDNFRLRSKLEPESALRSAARATTVIGKILDSMSRKRGINNKYSVWIVRLGKIFWSLVEVAVPRSFPDLVFRHLLKLVYFLEVLLIAASLLLLGKASEVRSFALTAFAITVAVHLTVAVLRDLIQSRSRWLNLVKAAAALVLVTLIAVGGLSVAAMLGADFAWNLISRVRLSMVNDAPIGLNFSTVRLLFWPVVVLTVFLVVIAKDVKAAFKRSD